MSDEAMKPTRLNPKDILGSGKLPLHLWPETATAYGCLAFLEGALKYGRLNFREAGVTASVYQAALKRHMNSWFEGEDIDPDSGLPHLAKALACVAILVEATVKNNLVDDRMYPTNYEKMVQELTPHVNRLKEMHKDKQPHHFTIQDKYDHITQEIKDNPNE